MHLLLHGCTNSSLTSHLCFIMGCAWQRRYVTWYCSLSPAAALSDLCLPMSGFNTAECYIMIMSGLGAGMLSASHWGRMKWINIPEEAESGGLHVQGESVCVCVCADRQPWEIRVHNCLRLQAVSLFFCLLHAQLFRVLIRAAFYHRGDIIFKCTRLWALLSPLCAGCKTSWSYISSVTQQAAGGRAGRSGSLARSHLSADLQAVCDRSLGAFSGCAVPSWEEASFANTSVVSPKVRPNRLPGFFFFSRRCENWKIWAL